MRKALILFIALFILVGCAGLPKTMPDLSVEKTAGVGDEFFRYELQTFPPENSQRFDLTVVELNQEKIGLQYAEYTFLSNPYTFQSGWAIKQGFNKRFDYQLADKVIRYKGYEFEIMVAEGGQIKYRRTK